MSTSRKVKINLLSIIVFVLGLLLVMDNSAFAIPYLQLDADPAIYVGGSEESVVTLGDVFTLYALVDTDTAGGTYYLSIALVPQETDPTLDLGSFDFDSAQIDVVGDMIYGIPPINLSSPPGTLGPHGIYETFFEEIEFVLDPTGTSDEYNVQTDPGGPKGVSGDDTLMYQEFAVDASELNDDYTLHFDLYTKDSFGKIDEFAPFSHDLQHTPIPASVIIGLLGMGVAGIKLRKYA